MMKWMSWVTVGLWVILWSACLPPDEAQLQTQVAQAGQTAVAQGQQYLATQAAQLKETAEAELATRLAQPFGGARKVALDPGHGWQGDSGAVGYGLQEKDVALDIAFRTRAILESSGIEVVMTRSGDDLEHDLAYAARFVNEQDADVAVSIHANGGDGTGTEACYTVGKSTDVESKALGQLLTDSISTRLSLRNRGVFPENADDRCARTKTTGWTQLYIHDMNPPAVIIETAFIGNAGDAELLRTRQQDFAQAIAEAIMSYFQAR
ncbi:MAG: N-acetylmuramoyl-L-alanine amidase [Chloroflexota bacterium]